ncbi:MAG TPA: LysR substrate-binding domain-containing protein [Thermoanaerobaculia bacterium]|nr:LysR substrate-binding domain-containing protein [Thermoanaerobaculia bacterium]
MELRHLRYFIAVADELHFGHAAARIHISQPALSQQIRNLEKELHVELFRRSKHRVELTRAGESFSREAREILASADRAADLARQADRSDRGRLVVGASPKTNWQIMRRVLRDFADHFPAVEVIVQVLATGTQTAALQSGGIDVGFVSLPVSGEGLGSECLERAPLRVALRRGHPMASHRKVALEDLASERYALWPRELEPGLFDQMTQIFTRAGFGEPIPLEGFFPSGRTTLGMVAAGLTIALVDPGTQVPTPGVVFRPLKKPLFVELGVVYRRGDSSPLLTHFLGSVRELARRAARTRSRAVNRSTNAGGTG